MSLADDYSMEEQLRRRKLEFDIAELTKDIQELSKKLEQLDEFRSAATKLDGFKNKLLEMLKILPRRKAKHQQQYFEKVDEVKEKVDTVAKGVKVIADNWEKDFDYVKKDGYDNVPGQINGLMEKAFFLEGELQDLLSLLYNILDDNPMEYSGISKLKSSGDGKNLSSGKSTTITPSLPTIGTFSGAQVFAVPVVTERPWELGVRISGLLDPSGLGEVKAGVEGWGFGGATEFKDKIDAQHSMLDTDLNTLMKIASEEELKGHTAGEKGAIQYFSSINYYPLNSVINKGSASDEAENITQAEVMEVITQLDSAMSKSPKRTKKVWRGVKGWMSAIVSAGGLDAYVDKVFQVGGVYHEESYVSTSGDPTVAMKFAALNEDRLYENNSKAQGLILEIVTPEGLNIVSESNLTGESEVMLPRDQDYFVVSKERVGAAWLVQLIAMNRDTREILDGSNSRTPSDISERFSDLRPGSRDEIRRACPWIN